VTSEHGDGRRGRNADLAVSKAAADWLKARLSPDRARTIVLRLEFHMRDGRPVYALIPADRTRPSDLAFHLQGLTFVIDPKTFGLVKGSEIDLDPDDPDAGIQVVNPNIHIREE
jgi:Fe-S cluster assembly iron-binding protein IscA